MNPSLEVNRDELVGAIKVLAKLAKAKQSGEVIVSFECSKMVLECGGMAIMAGAGGSWPGQARVNREFIFRCARVLPQAGLISVRVEENRLHVANSSAPCVWQSAAANVIQLPVNPSFMILLALPQKYSDEEIAHSGLTSVVRAAEQRREELTVKAATVLEPLGVRLEDLRQLIAECIQRTDRV